MLLIAHTASAASVVSYDAVAAPQYLRNGPGAVVLVRQGTKLLFRKGYGMASIELGVPMHNDHVFRIGSISKTFTATAIMQLVDQGKIALNAPVRQYLPALPATWQSITIEHLLVHAAGIPNLEHAPGFRQFQSQARTLDEVIEYFRNEPLEFAAGSATNYSSSGYIVLGKVIEIISQQRYADYVAQHIAAPLGLRRTAYGTETTITPGMVTGYRNQQARAAFISMTVPHAAGALVSSAEDLATFTQALHGGKLISSGSYARMISPYLTSNGQGSPFGYGLVQRTLNGEKLIGHSGSIEGFSADVEYDAKTKTVVVVLQNSQDDPYSASRLSKRLMALAQGRPLTVPQAVAVAPALLERLAGNYPTASESRVIRFEHGVLTEQLNGKEPTQLSMSSATEAFIAGSDRRLSFHVLDGQAVSLSSYTEGEPSGTQIQRRDPLREAAHGMNSAAFTELAGYYQLSPRLTVNIFERAGRFFLQASGQQPLEIFPQSMHRFAAREVLISVEFVRDSAGRISRLDLHQGGQTVPAARLK